MNKELSKIMGQATKWSSLAEIFAKLIAPITNAILARLLVPEAFGVVATLTMVVSFAEIFTDAGFQKYLVQHQFEDDSDLEISTNVAFWTNLIFSLLIWALISWFATPITNMVGSPGCEAAITAMGLQIPLLAFSSIQMARYRRDFNFKSLFIARMMTSFIPLVVTIPLAMYTRSYWALVIGMLAREVFNVIVLALRSTWKPRFKYSIRKLKQMLSFTMWTVVENISIWLTNYIGTFIVGVGLSAYYLGLYKTAISTVNSITMLITSSTTPVLFAALSRYQDDDEAFREVFYRFQRLVALIVFPLGFGLFVYREFVTSILLGSQWMETADFLGMWALTSALCIIFSTYNSEVFRSKGKPRLSVLTQILHIVVLVPVMLIFMNRGFTELTIARSTVRLEIILVSAVIAYVAFGMSFWTALKNVWSQLVSSMIMAFVGIFIHGLIDSIIYEIATVVVCCIVYGICMLTIPAGRKILNEIPVVYRILGRVKHILNQGRSSDV